jgi:hypothetical protein
MANLGFGGGSNPYLGQNNPYLEGTIDSALGDMTRNYNNVAKPAMESAMVNSGSFGNAGLGQMQGEQQRQLAQTMGNTANQMRADDYNRQQQMYQWQKGLDQNQGQFDANLGYQNRALDQNNSQFGRTLDQNQNQFNSNLGFQNQQLAQNQNQFNSNLGFQNQQLAQQNAQFGDTLGLQNRQLDTQNNQFNNTLASNNYWNNANYDRSLYNDAYSQNMNNAQFATGLLGNLGTVNQGDITNANTIQNTPLNYWNQFSNAANAAGSGFGTTSGTATGATNPWVGALGGAQLANTAYNQWTGTPSGTTAAPGTGYDLFNNNPSMAIPDNLYGYTPSF